MRIACIHIPQYALQCATRLDPSLRGAAVAMAGVVGPPNNNGLAIGSGPLHAPIVVACSRAAWGLGIRLGMTATAARAQSAHAPVTIVGVEPAIERETVRAIAEAVLGLTPTVDLGGRVGVGGAHLAMYAEVPAKTRGASFGERVLERLEVLGLTGRIGIADDRFTAWVAAAHGNPTQRAERAGTDRVDDDRDAVTMVPRGGSAAFLSPRPLSLLQISLEVQHMLEALGVRTLGEFAALPAPSVASRPHGFEADYQALARGDSGAMLRPYAPEAAIREEIVVSAGNVLDAERAVSGPTAIALLARRIALRLGGRGRAAVRLELGVLANGELREIPLAPADPLIEAEDLARAIAPVMETLTASSWRLRAVIVGEAVVGASADAPGELTLSQEFSLPTSELASSGRAVAQLAIRSARAAQAAQAAGTLHPRLDLPPTRAAEPRTNAARNDEVSTSPLVSNLASDPLALVLSTSGSLFALSSPIRAERPHRRTRRGKQRRTRPATVASQSRLFDTRR